MQENSSRPEGLPPSQGGKYVGFGSAPAPRPGSRNSGAGGVDDVSAMFSKLGAVANTVAGTAAVAVSRSAQNVNTLLQEKGVGETVQQTGKVIGERGYALAQVGGGGGSGGRRLRTAAGSGAPGRRANGCGGLHCRGVRSMQCELPACTALC